MSEEGWGGQGGIGKKDAQEKVGSCFTDLPFEMTQGASRKSSRND